MSRMIRISFPRLVLVAALGLAAAGCQPSVDLQSAVQLEDVVTGWFDAGVTEDGKNKLVPSISFRVRNTADQALSAVQFNLIFRRVGDPEEWSTVLVRGIGSDGLAAGATSEPIVVRAPQGYTGTQPRAQLLQNRLFVDAKIEIFGKQGSAVWTSLGDFPIERQLLTK